MWDLTDQESRDQPGIKPKLPALQGRFLQWTIRDVSRACTLNPFNLKNQEWINEFTVEWRKQTQEAFINFCWNGHNSKLSWELQDCLVYATPRASETQWWKELKPSPTKVWWELLCSMRYSSKLWKYLVQVLRTVLKVMGFGKGLVASHLV